MSPSTRSWIDLDQAHAWHPFTQMDDWSAPGFEPIVLESGRGATLRDTEGREYIDGNSSIWTNLHGHHHPKLDAAIADQLGRVAHTSFLGFTNPPATRLAAELCALWPEGTLTRAFFSDNGSTAIEVALKMAVQHRQQTGQPERRRFVAFHGAYHGDTMGASSLGGIGLFHERFAAWQFPVTHIGASADLEKLPPGEIAAVVIEPLIQGANGMRLWPRGLLAEIRRWCDANDVFLIADEIMTGFGRTGTMFACEQEEVIPDFLALAKGLSGGYSPLAATLTTERVFAAFRGGAERTLYYGHTYTGHQLGCAAALANLAIFREEDVLGDVRKKIELMSRLFDQHLREIPEVYDIRQCGFIAGIELRRASGEAFPPGARVGSSVCVAARKHGLLTRPIVDTVVLMPPFCVTAEELDTAVRALAWAIRESAPQEPGHR